MSRMCEDCGIARGQDCICDPRAGLGHPDPRNFSLPNPAEDGVDGEPSAADIEQHERLLALQAEVDQT
jgi:hypothetical protein